MFGSAVVRVRSAKDERDRYKAESESEEKSKELTKLRSDFKGLQKQHGQLRIELCGSEKLRPIGLSIAVQFIDAQDSALAKHINALFWSPLRPRWKTDQIDQIKWHQNPSGEARIVLFSDHEHAAGMTAAINDCELLEERVDRFPKKPDMKEDVTFIVFNESN